MSQATVTTVLDRLEMDGLAIRERSTIDRRKVHARLTEKGNSALTWRRRLCNCTSSKNSRV